MDVYRVIGQGIILGRASGSETFKRFLPHTPSSNVAAGLGLLRLAPAGGGGFAGDRLTLLLGEGAGAGLAAN